MHWWNELDAQKAAVAEMMKDPDQRSKIWEAPQIALSGYGASGKSYSTLNFALIESAPTLIVGSGSSITSRLYIHVWTRKTGFASDHPAILSFDIRKESARKIAKLFEEVPESDPR